MKTYPAFLLLAAGALLMAISLFLRMLQKRSRARYVVLPAVVREVVRRHGKNGHALYQPVLEFEVDGVCRRVAARICTAWPRYQENEPVEITYDPLRDTVIFGGRNGLRRAWIILLAVGCALLLGGGALLLKTFLAI